MDKMTRQQRKPPVKNSSASAGITLGIGGGIMMEGGGQDPMQVKDERVSSFSLSGIKLPEQNLSHAATLKRCRSAFKSLRGSSERKGLTCPGGQRGRKRRNTFLQKHQKKI